MLSVPIANSPAPHGAPHSSIDAVTHARICVLSMEHDDLDRAIEAFAAANSHYDLTVARLKKRKLRIRDEIAGLLVAPMVEADHG